MSDIDWAKIHERLFGYPADQPGPPPEAPIVESAIEALADAFLGKGRLVYRQIALEAQKAGIPASVMPYLYALLDGGSANWPPMTEDQKKGIVLAIDLLKQSGHKTKIKLNALPGLEYEKALDEVLLKLGTWGQTKLLGEFIREYASVLKSYRDEIRKIHPEIPRGSEEAILSAYIQQALKKRPFSYQFGHLLKKAIELAFG